MIINIMFIIMINVICIIIINFIIISIVIDIGIIVVIVNIFLVPSPIVSWFREPIRLLSLLL